MAEERPDDPGPSPDSRPKRAPPTIDLQATEISSEPSRTEATEEAAKEIGKETGEETAGHAGEAAAPGACARLLAGSMERLAAIGAENAAGARTEAGLVAALETGARVFGDVSFSAPSRAALAEREDAAANRSVLGDFLLARWRRDLLRS